MKIKRRVLNFIVLIAFFNCLIINSAAHDITYTTLLFNCDKTKQKNTFEFGITARGHARVMYPQAALSHHSSSCYHREFIGLQMRGEKGKLLSALVNLRHELKFKIMGKKRLRAKIAFLEKLLANPLTEVHCAIKERTVGEAEDLINKLEQQRNRELSEYRYPDHNLVQKYQYELAKAREAISQRPDYAQEMAKRREQQVAAQAIAAQELQRIKEQQMIDAKEAERTKQIESAKAAGTAEFCIVPVQAGKLNAILPHWAEQLSGPDAERYKKRIDGAHEIAGPVAAIDLTPQATSMLHDCDVYKGNFATVYESQLQQILHNEFVTIANDFALVYVTHQHNQSMHALNQFAVQCLDIGRQYNQQGNPAAASKIADFCWASLDLAKNTVYIAKEVVIGAGEGVVQGAFNTGDMVLHPIDTVCHVAKGAGHILDCAGKVALHLGTMLALADDMQSFYAVQYPQDVERRVDEMRDRMTWAASTVQHMQQECAKLSPRDVGRIVGTFCAEGFLQHKILVGIGKVISVAGTNVSRIARRLVENPQQIVSTAEGLQVHVVDEAARVAQEMMHLQDMPGSSGVKGVGAVAEVISVERQLIETVRANLASMVQKDLPLIRAQFDGIRKGFAEFANKYIKIDYEHILGLETNYSRTNAVKLRGFHHDFMEMVEKSGAFKFMNKVVDKNGCYKIDIFQHGVSVSTKSPTFFPSNWSREKVISKIYEAYDDFIASGKLAVLRPEGKYVIEGITNEGITIEMCITRNGTMTTAYPINIKG